MKDYARFLFIGDSITDSNRIEDEEGIGFGYVRNIKNHLILTYPEKSLEVLNKGVSGNKITELEERWEKDVLSHQPDYLSISIGVNDVWRQLDSPRKEQVTPEKFLKIYTHLLDQVKGKTNADIILMEPTILQEDIDSEGNQKLREYVQIVQELSKHFDTILVPTHQAFINFLSVNQKTPLTTDGVHMNSVGDMLMARTWVSAFHEKVGW
ncbi:SGNH/GDSL hydrolase family protein [Radiobacillus kanasensis]|uniref:SGNH/GDSL hydrolase family protein n=1 Tax=Radiobacillus kanasensis TaxID=2844358 RepID=UPI001E498032|nr:SGNH/GDSL hydrolase family protein [Radiobacillus kanasensis]UFT99716.1 SGNH/GDSL hydrolase family protein [Radiobacillus kanasensis]